MSIPVCTKKGNSFCVPKMQIALVSIERKIKFNVGRCGFAPTHFNLVPSFPGYEIAVCVRFGQENGASEGETL